MTYQPMTEPERREYAETLMCEAALRVDVDLPHEVAQALLPEGRDTIDDTDTKAVLDLIKNAVVFVCFD